MIGISNQIEVAPSARASDIKRRIEDALLRSAQLEATRVEVNVQDNKVTLNGCVNSWIEAARPSARPGLPRRRRGQRQAGRGLGAMGRRRHAGPLWILPMRAMSQRAPGAPLSLERLPTPRPGPGQVLLKVEACAVCRTDLHVVDGELPGLRYPVTPGHEVIGIVEETGEGVDPRLAGRRAGAAWLAWTCGRCAFCLTGRENLCDAAAFTGYTRDGGFASHMLAETAYVYPLPQAGPAESMAPWMCAGLIGWARCERLATPAAWACTGSARPGRRWRKSAPGNIAVCMPTPTRRRRRPVARAHAGRGLPATAASTRRNPWTRPSSSRPSASLYPWPCGPSARADASCAAAYT